MADVNSNININFNTAAALAQLRQLQAGLSKFHQSLAEGNLAAANAQKGLNAQLLQSIGATGKFSASQVKVAGSTLAFTSALEKNKLSLREYYRYTMAAATANTRVMGKAFAQEREIINRARRDRVKALQAQYIQMNKANSGFMDAIRIMPKSLQMASGRFTELGTRIQYAAQRQQFLNQLLKQGSTQLLNFGKNTQWAGRQLMVGLTMPLALLGGMAAKSFRELEKEIVRFRRVYGDSFTNDAETDAAVENIRRLANEYVKYGQSVTKTMEMAATAAAAGFEGAALSAQVATATKLAILGEVELQDALKTTISLQSAFGISSEELAKKIDFLNAVENQTLLSIEDLTIAIPKAAPVVKQLGGSVEDLAFFLTAMKEGGINASEGANALKSGLASLINPAEKSAKFLAELGININGIVESNAGDIKGTVIGFAQALDTLDPLNRARAIEQLFGKFQFSRLSTLFQNVVKDGSQASRALDLAGSSVEELAILSEREMKKIEDSIGVKFQSAVEKFKQDIMPLGKAFLEALTPVVQFFGSMFEKFNGLSDNTKKVIAIIVAAVAGLGPVVLMTFGLLMNGIANVIKLFALLRGGIARLNGQTNVMGAGFNYMTQEQIENAASSQQLHQTHTRLVEVFNVERTSVNALASSYNSLSTQMRAMAAQNPALFARGMGGATRAVSKLPPVRKYQDGILSVPGPKGAGDVVPAMLSPGEAVIPTDTTNKYRGLITAMFKDKVPGFMAGRIPGGPARMSLQDLKIQRVQDGSRKTKQQYPGTHPEKQSGSTFVGMPKSALEASQSRQILDKISGQVSRGRFGTLPATDFGTLLQPFSGRSFPARGVGGIYRKPSGELVVVKPTIDEKTALAEVRATQIAREVHGLVSPKQNIRTMMDPTDPSGRRKFIVVESPYDPRIAAASGKFTKSDMVKQLVASTLRGDKDLQRANLSGNVLSDVGTAGVFDRASGFRDFAKTMPSMEQQAVVNLLGVKGGAKKFFAQETSGIAAGMTPAQYDAAIKGEINRSIPRLEKVVKSFNLDPQEQVVYGNMIKRLKDGAKTDWAALQPVHARAGEGIIKAMAGLFDDPALTPEIREQLRKYTTGSIPQQQSMIDQLKLDAKNSFTSKLAELDLNNPTRSAIVRAAWEGGKAPVPPSMKEKRFSVPRQTSFLNEISSMTPVTVDGVTKYVHDVDMEKFLSDPDGRAKYARTKDQVINNLLYRMGAQPDTNGRFVANGKFSGSRFAGLSAFKTDLRSTGKESGSWKPNVKKQFRKTLSAGEKAYNAEYANKKYIKMMTDAGLTESQARAELKAELSHREKTGTPGRGPQKWLRGTGSFDSLIVNRYMNGEQRLTSLLEWNKKNGYSLIPQDGIDKYYQAASFMRKGRHPSNAYEASLVALAADADLKALDDPRVPSKDKTDYSREKLNAMRSLLGEKARSGFYESATRYNFGAGNLKGLVLAKLGEYIYDRPKQTLEKVTRKNAKKAPSNVKASTGIASDNMVVKESPGRSVVTKSQAGMIARGRGVTFLPGRDAGDPTITSQSTRGASSDELSRAAQKRINAGLIQKANLLRKDNRLTETQIQRAIEKIRIQRTEAEISRARIHQEKQSLALAKKNAPAVRKKEIKDRRMARQQKVGGFSGGASMALGTAGMGMMMTGNMGAGMGLMGASAVAGMAPMLAGMGPVGWVATAAIAVGGSLYLLDKRLKDSAREQSNFVREVSATTEKMQKVGEYTGQVGASEIMQRIRETGFRRGYIPRERQGQEFGINFADSQVGQDMSKTFIKSIENFGAKEAAKIFGLELAAYVSDGVLSAEQAQGIAFAIGSKMQDQNIVVDIEGQLVSVIGISGSDLTKNPLAVRMRLIAESDNQVERSLKEMQRVSQETTLSGGNEAASLSGFLVNSISLAQAQADAMAKYYQDEKKVLEEQLKQTTNKEKQLEIQNKLSKLAQDASDAEQILNSEVLRKINKSVSIFQKNIQTNVLGDPGKRENAFFDSLKESVRSSYKKTGQKEEADRMLERTAKVSNEFRMQGFDSYNQGQDFEVRMNLLVANKLISPTQANSFMDLFAGKLKDLQTTLDVGIQSRGAGKTSELLSMVSNFTDKAAARTMAMNITMEDNETFDRLTNILGLANMLDGKEINMDKMFGGTAGESRLKVLDEQFSALTSQTDALSDKEITTDFLVNFDSNYGTNTSKADLDFIQEQFKGDKKGQVNALRTYEIISQYVNSIEFDSPEAKKMFEQEAERALVEGYQNRTNKSQTFEEYRSVNYALLLDKAKSDFQLDKDGFIQTRFKNVIGEQVETSAKTPTGTELGSGVKKENPLSFLDGLAMRIKQVRDNSFNALKPVESLLAAFTNKKTKQGAFSLFDGIQNRLSRLGAGKDLRDAVASMSAEDFSKVAALKGDKALFTFAKGKAKSKDTITGLTKTGKAVNQEYNEANLGEFNLANQDTVKNIQQQSKAYRTLIANGLSASQALEVVADQGQAAAIAAGAIKKGTPEWKKYIKNIKEANTALERQTVLNNAIRANEDFKMYQKMPELVDSMKELGYSTDQIDTVLGDPQLAKFLVDDLKDGKLDAEAVTEYLNNIEAKKIIDIQVKLNKGDLAGAAAQGRQLVDDLFDAQEGLIFTGPESVKMRSNERTIRDLEAQILPFRRDIEAVDKIIQKSQREIEENYTRPIEALNEEVSDLSRELEVNPLFGDRAIKKIQDENNMLSNDLSIISNAAEKVNEKYDEQAEALSKVQEINANIMEQQMQQIDLADALSQGDIAAAARAAQSMRQTGAAQFATGQMDALEQARKNAIDSLVGPQSGLTQDQINEKQFQNSQRIYAMETDPARIAILKDIQDKQDDIYNFEEEREAALRKIRDLEDKVYRIKEKSIEPLQEEIDALNYENALLQVSIDKQIESLRVLGKTRDEWTEINARLDASQAALNAANNSAALAGLLSAAKTLDLTWGDILAKLAEYAKGVPASVQNAVNKIGNINQTGSPTPGTKLPAGSDPYDIMSNSDMAKANKEYFTDVVLPAIQSGVASSSQIIDYANAVNESRGTPGALVAMAKGGLVPKYFVNGGYARGTDTVPAMLTPGEFIMSKYAVQSYGIDKMKAMNSGSSVNDSVYNYSISVNVTSDANPDEIARVVMTQIKNIDSQKLRGTRF